MKVFEGGLHAKGLRFGIVVSRFNEFVTSKLLDGSLDCLKRHGCEEQDIDIAWVSGTFEIPLILKIMAESKQYDALIGLGAVLKGSTSHHAYIASEVIKGTAKINLDFAVPIAFGIITPDTMEQAIERAGLGDSNKGWEAALTAIETANLAKKIRSA